MPATKILNISAPDPVLTKSLSYELGISPVIAQLLINRGIKTCADAEKFLSPRLTDLLDPFSFPDMPLAVNFIKKAIKNKDKIMIFGDYDVDGVTSLALVENTLKSLGADVCHYIPHRVNEGYGLSKNICRICKDKGIKLLITVDCGTNSSDLIKELRENKIEVVITDHHEQSDPESQDWASAIINPKLKNSNYKFRDLAGVGVAYKLCQALTGKPLEKDLDLVCLGTIADSVALTGENWVIARQGLKEIAATKRLGLRTLINSSGIKDKAITPISISFILGPRLNASGRLDSAETALELLTTSDPAEAESLAKLVEGFNRQRQKIESNILQEAQDLIDKEVNFKQHQVMVVAKEGWHLGVLGIVASKLADRFYRPAILISIQDGLCRGSGRSIENFHLFNGLMECESLLDNFGGHSHAIGMVIPQENIAEFRQKINDFARQTLAFQDLVPTLNCDMELNLGDLNREFIRDLEKLEPFGQGNLEPLFYSRGLKLKGAPRLYSRDTLKFWVTDGKLTYSAIGFGMGGLMESLVNSNGLDLVYRLKIDSWNGSETVLLEVEEMFLK
jgi:single-stranded-DNA-specific exonuclease